jgi:probable rRNA maturation factor
MKPMPADANLPDLSPADDDDTGLVAIDHADLRWQALNLPDLILKAAQATLAHQGYDADGLEISVLACDDARIAELNGQFRAKSVPTNVLSWPAWDLSADDDGGTPDGPEIGTVDDPEALGNIAIAYDTCAREAAEQGKSMGDHTLHLVVHSLLHLLGYDHIRDKDAALMEDIEVQILASLGVSDPYEAGAEAPQ